MAEAEAQIGQLPLDHGLPDSNALSFLDEGLSIAKRILARGDTILRAGARPTLSGHAERTAILTSFKSVLDDVGEVAFFEVLFSQLKLYC